MTRPAASWLAEKTKKPLGGEALRSAVRLRAECRLSRRWPGFQATSDGPRPSDQDSRRHRRHYRALVRAAAGARIVRRAAGSGPTASLAALGPWWWGVSAPIGRVLSPPVVQESNLRQPELRVWCSNPELTTLDAAFVRTQSRDARRLPPVARTGRSAPLARLHQPCLKIEVEYRLEAAVRSAPIHRGRRASPRGTA